MVGVGAKVWVCLVKMMYFKHCKSVSEKITMISLTSSEDASKIYYQDQAILETNWDINAVYNDESFKTRIH